MGKRSNFDRRQDYATPRPALLPLLPFLKNEGIRSFAEPCCGVGNLVCLLENLCGLVCLYRGDIRDGLDARDEFDFGGADAIITNPPWRRDWMHPLIEHFLSVGLPTWLLFDSDWMFNRHAAPYIPHCSTIVAVGRVKWIPGSKHSGMDNAAWYRFEGRHRTGPRFFGRREIGDGEVRQFASRGREAVAA